MRTCNSMASLENNQIELVFFNFHRKLCQAALRFCGFRVRLFIEHTVLFVAVSAFCILILCHRTFVYRGGLIKSEALTMNGWSVPSMCLGSIEGFRYDVDVTHIMIVDTDELESHVYDPTQDHFAYCGFDSRADLVSDNICDDQSETCSNNVKPDQSGEASRINAPLGSCVSHSFSQSKGFLFLEPSSFIHRNITAQCAVISTRDKACFSDDPILQYIGRSSEGFLDTIALNWILGAKNGTNGFIYHHKTSDLIELEGYIREYTFRWPTQPLDHSHDSLHTIADPHLVQHQHDPHHRWHHNYLVFKAGVILSTLLLFFITTTLVSFTLRETQDRMLYFTVQLNLYIRRRQPYAILIVTHVIENMVFVPIMIGTIFFLMDCFYNNDRILSLIILSWVWLCEAFSAVSMRTIESSIYFPKVFFAYFTLFHIYYFSCPFGFTYATLSSTVLFELHSMLFFWNRYELPAVETRQVSRENPRMVLFAHPVTQTLESSSPSSSWSDHRDGNNNNSNNNNNGADIVTGSSSTTSGMGGNQTRQHTLRRLGSGTLHPSMYQIQGRIG